MKIAVALFCFLGAAFAAPNLQSLSLHNDGSYKFSYETSKETGSHSRTEEKRPDGTIVGRYAFEDPTGDLRVVHYRAGDFGYVAKGAVGVAGAPDSQFPAEPTEGQTGNEEDNRRGDDDDQTSDDNESTDDAKEMKLPSASTDGVPEGFPIGFFDRGFIHGFRRLPEPTNEDESTEGGNKADEPDDEKKTDVKSAVDYFHPIFPYSSFQPHTWSYPLQHSNSPSNLQQYSGSLSYPLQHSGSHAYPLQYSGNLHHPMHVYSYQVAPQSHSYYYSY